MDVLLCLLAVLALSCFFVLRCRLPAALAPLCALSACAVWLVAFGVAGLLWPGTLLLYIACFAAGAFGFYKARRTRLRRLLQPGFLLVVVFALVAFLYLGIRQPIFSKWDEFSFWGTAAKLLVQDNALYTTADIGWAWTGTQSPALPHLGYFVHFGGQSFAAWKVYWIDDLLMVSCAATLLATVDMRRWRLWVPGGVLALLLPYIFSVYYRIVYLDVTYINSYGDLPAGLVFGGVLCSYIALRRAGRAGAFVLLPLSLFALIKDNTLPIVLVAAVMIAADMLFFKPQPQGLSLKKPKEAKRRLWRAAGVALPVAVPLAWYSVWALHRTWANAQNVVTEGNATGVSQLDSIVQTVQMLLGVTPETERFYYARKDFVYAFFSGTDYPVSMFGSTFATVCVILGICAFAAVLAQRGSARKRVVLASVLALLGFAGYEFVMLVSYGFLFKTTGMLDWDRYLSSYLVGWFMLAVGMLVPALVRIEGRRATRGRAAAGRIAVRLGSFAAAAVLLAVFCVRATPQLTVLGYPDSVFDGQRHVAEQASIVRTRVRLGDEDTRVFFVNQGEDDGELWFEYSYNLLPVVLDFSMQGGLAFVPQQQPGDGGLTLEKLQAYLTENGCGYILVAKTDEAFSEAFGSLFDDGLPQSDAVRLYTRTAEGTYALYVPQAR